MKSLLMLLALTIPAGAQTAWTSSTALNSTISSCEINGEKWEELGTTCHTDPMFRQKPGSVLRTSSTWATNSPAPKCPEGYSLVMRSSGSPACAREIIDAQ